MKNLYDFKELTDSKEMFEAKSHPFVPIFITIISLIICISLLWAYFGEMDVVAKASGIIRPNGEVFVVQSEVNGEIKQISIQEGNTVKKGDVLLELEDSGIQLKKSNYDEEILATKDEIEGYKRLKESIELEKNKLEGSDDQSELVVMYDQYISELEALDQELFLQEQDTKAQSNELSLKSEIIKENLKSTTSTKEEEIEYYEERIKELESKVERQTLLKKSYEKSENLIKDKESKEYYQYVAYDEQVNILMNNLNDLNASLEEALNSQQEQSMEEYEKAIENNERELNRLKDEATLAAVNKIEELNAEKESMKLQLNQLQDSSEEKQALELEKNLIDNQKLTLEQKLSNLKNKGEMTKEQYKQNTIIEINNFIKEKEDKLKSLQQELEMINSEIKGYVFTSPIDGVVNISTDLHKGKVVQAGEVILKVLPQEADDYRVELAVSNEDISKIKEGDPINFHLLALPFKEYGEVTGKVRNISTDSTVDPESGLSFYTVEASIKETELISYSGKSAEIKNGMLVNANIISDSKKVIYFILEKINLRDE